MLVLGLSGSFSGEDRDLISGIGGGFFHDATACLIEDGRLIAAVEEERLNRIKKTIKFPINAIRACLSEVGADASDVDAVGYYFAENTVDRAMNALYMRDPSLPIRYSRRFVTDFLREVGIDVAADRIVFAEHHRAHGLSCYARSGMSSALTVVMDGRGERHSTTVFHAHDGQLQSLATHDVSKSLGYFYASAIEVLGYGLGDEYKIMGLAPYGDPAVYSDFFSSIYTLADGGDYTLRPISLLFREHGVRPRRAGEPFMKEHVDFAAGVQRTLEEIAMHVLGYWARRTGLVDLCFVGGVAHNSSLNGKILRSGLFENVFIHPAAHDAGAAEGAALVAAQRLGSGTGFTRERMRSAGVGPSLGHPGEIEAELAQWTSMITYTRPSDIVDSAARLLAGGSVLGWAQGRSEYGPRALGHRSILADARPAANKEKINAMIKKREEYRPFAPAVTTVAADTYFDLPATGANYEFMSFVVDVRNERRAELGAVTHVDGSARLQIVDAASNARFHSLIERFGEITGVPVLLNTSFNNNAEPIVQSVHDALTCFLTTDLDGLVIEDFLICRRPDATIDDLVPTFRPVTRIAKTRRSTTGGGHTTDHEIYLDYAKGGRRTISADAYAILELADGNQSVIELAKATEGIGDPVRQELFRLWQDRFFVLRPA